MTGKSGQIAGSDYCNKKKDGQMETTRIELHQHG
jgi:hypothetical protein